MSSPTYPVTSAGPVTVFRRQQSQAAYNLYNISTAGDIYLDDSPQTPGTTAGVPLHPGAQITWEAGRECYAITATGVTATLLTSPAAGGYFDPYTLAANILTLAPGGQTLAQQIAQNIFTQGVPPVDNPVLILDDVQTVNAGGLPTYVNAGTIFDVSRYSSLYVLSEDITSLTDTTCRQVDFKFGETSQNPVSGPRYYNTGSLSLAWSSTGQPHGLGVFTPQFFGTIRVRGPQLKVGMTSIGSQSGLTFAMYGSYRETPTDIMWLFNNTTNGNPIPSSHNNLTYGGSFAFNGATNAVTGFSATPTVYPGQYNVYINTSQIASLSITRMRDGQELYKFTTTAGTPNNLGPWTLPNEPIIVLLTTTVAVTSYNIAFTRVGYAG